jgi:hypothetical protein
MTSSEPTPSSWAASAASRATLTMGPYATRVRSLPSRSTLALPIGSVATGRSTSCLAQ